VLRALTVAFFALLYLLPLILKLWRGETTHDRGAAARAQRERAELEADTAIAVKRAEVRTAVETMWAEQQLESARLAVEAQTEIDREQQRRRVGEVLGVPLQIQSERVAEPAELPAGERNLPARVEAAELEQQREGSLIPDITKVASRWIRPFVPPIVASAVETATKPLRGVRQIFTEEEEIHFSMKRSRTVTVHSEDADEQAEQRVATSAVVSEGRDHIDGKAQTSSLTEAERQRALSAREGAREMRGPQEPRQLTSGE
jgi:hypothetical protein